MEKTNDSCSKILFLKDKNKQLFLAVYFLRGDIGIVLDTFFLSYLTTFQSPLKTDQHESSFKLQVRFVQCPECFR